MKLKDLNSYKEALELMQDNKKVSTYSSLIDPNILIKKLDLYLSLVL